MGQRTRAGHVIYKRQRSAGTVRSASARDLSGSAVRSVAGRGGCNGEATNDLKSLQKNCLWFSVVWYRTLYVTYGQWRGGCWESVSAVTFTDSRRDPSALPVLRGDKITSAIYSLGLYALAPTNETMLLEDQSCKRPGSRSLHVPRRCESTTSYLLLVTCGGGGVAASRWH